MNKMFAIWSHLDQKKEEIQKVGFYHHQLICWGLVSLGKSDEYLGV